jgi:hypothetical protein
MKSVLNIVSNLRVMVLCLMVSQLMALATALTH